MDLNFSSKEFQYFLMPIMSTQMLLMVLLYFVIIYRGALKGKNLFCAFLVIFILLLLNRFFHYLYVPGAYNSGQLFLYARMSSLFTLGIPILLTALFMQCRIKMHRFFWLMPYIIGFIVSLIYNVTHDISRAENYFYASTWEPLFPFTVNTATHRYTVAIGIFLLIVPCLYLIYHQLMEQRDKITLAFLYGALSFGLVFLTCMFNFQFHWIYSIGSAFLSFFWCYAVYLDIQEMKGKTLLLTEELTLLLRSENKNIQPELESLLDQLEQHSAGNLQHYKLKVREILNLLTDNSISSGGDIDGLLKRNEEKMREIRDSKNAAQIRQLATHEVLALSQIITETPEKRSDKIVVQVKEFIDNYYYEQIDIAQLSELVHVSDSYLMRIFKKSTNQTIKQYTNELRIEKAKQLLLKFSVTETAFSVGFNDANYFSTVFKKATGMNPVSFQESLSHEKTFK